MKLSLLIISLFISIGISVSFNANAQPIPDEYKTESIPEQIDYLKSHTRVYENFRAIREDIFQLVSRNVNDTLRNMRRRISTMLVETDNLNGRIDSLRNQLSVVTSDLDEMTKTKNSISVLGMEVNKTTYNSIMWSILGILLLLLAVGYLTFKQNRLTTVKTKKELEGLQKEFDDYRQKTRIERERTTMEHFNEIKKLKASLPGSRQI